MQNVGKWNRIDDIEKTQNIQVNQKDRKGRKMESQSSEIIIIGAAIIDILVRPADEEVFRSGSSSAEEIRMSTGADALNEATVLARLGKRVRLETVIGSDRAGAFIREHCQNSGIELPEDCEREGLPTGINVVLIDSRSVKTPALCVSRVFLFFHESARRNLRLSSGRRKSREKSYVQT